MAAPHQPVSAELFAWILPCLVWFSVPSLQFLVWLETSTPATFLLVVPAFFLLIIARLWRRPASQTLKSSLFSFPPPVHSNLPPTPPLTGLFLACCQVSQSLQSLQSHPFILSPVTILDLASSLRFCQLKAFHNIALPQHLGQPSNQASQQPSLFAASSSTQTANRLKLPPIRPSIANRRINIIFASDWEETCRSACLIQPPQLLTDLSTSNLWPSRRGTDPTPDDPTSLIRWYLK